MELFSAEAETIRKRVAEWLEHPTYELEATFGAGGEVNATTFLAVAQRLRAKGYTSLPQEDRLTVTTPDHYRFTLVGLGIIQQYCRDDIMSNKPFEAIIKDRTAPESQIDLEDYGVRIKSRRETPLASDDAKLKALFAQWQQQQKAFRMIRRWTFEGDGMRVDMSIVRQTKKAQKGGYRWQRRYRDQDVMAQPPIYEIEVELLRKPDDVVGAPEPPMRRLIKGVGEVLRGMQKHTLLLRKSVKDKVLAAYAGLVGTDQFRGPTQRVLQKKNFGKERVADEGNIRDGYNVTDKADGLRALGFCDSRGELFLIDMGLNVYRTGLVQPECRLSLLDGEWITTDKEHKAIQQYMAFDIFYAPDKLDVSKFAFQTPAADKELESRHGQLKAWIARWNKDGGAKVVSAGVTPQTRLQVAAKEFIFAKAGDMSIFRAAARVLDTARIYYTDGLIFTANADPLPSGPLGDFKHQFKWKPAKDNTVDFLVVTEKAPGTKFEDLVTTGVKPGSGETVMYKTLNLMVGSSFDDPRDLILNMKELPSRDMKAKDRKYRPVRFNPVDYPDPKASICNLPIHEDPDTGETYVMTEHSREPIQDKTVVEMAYNPLEAPGWRWYPLRVRMDKTEKLQRGILGRTLNSEKVANDTWNSIYDPITESMIRTGSDEPSALEREVLQAARAGEAVSRKYYDTRKAPVQDERLVKKMRDFHNKIVKEETLFRVGLGGGTAGKVSVAPAAKGAAAPAAPAAPVIVGRSLVDMACGRAADLHKWRHNGANFVLGVDYSGPNINDKSDSAYKRYMGVLQEAGVKKVGEPSTVPPMVFAVANSAKNYRSGAAAATPEDETILRAVFGSGPQGDVPPYVENVVAGALRRGVDCMSCMFALHYFFDAPENLNGFLQNVAQNLKVGGLFIGCCFDGGKVFELLRGVPKGGSKTGTEKGALLWTITKQYDEDDMPEGDDAVGLPIDVEFITIGTEHREYLVPFPLLEAKMAEIGCTLLNEDELKAVGLKESTATFDRTWETVKDRFVMPDPVKEFSFMNRWFIFKRRSEGVPAAAAAEEAKELTPTQVERLRTRAIEILQAREGGGAAMGPRPVAGPGLAPYKELEAMYPEDAAQLMAEVTGAAAAEATAARPANAQAPAVTAARAQELAEEAEAASLNTGAAAAPGRTLPVAPGTAAPAQNSYTLAETFVFYEAAALKDTLGIKDKGAARWISPTAPFPIQDPTDTAIEYPTVEHFLAAMRFKLASDKPELAASIFSRDGTIHQKFLRKRLEETGAGAKALSEDRDFELMKEEIGDVRDEVRPAAMKRYRATFDPARWAAEKDRLLRVALEQRWQRDARLRKVLEAARAKGKYLLYYTPGTSTSNLGGVRRASGVIEGENKVGKLLMELAGFPGYGGEAPAAAEEEE